MKQSLAVVGVLVLAIAGVATGLAAIPGSDGVIHACSGKGGLRVIDAEAGEKCHKREDALSWSQRGPQGEPGASGYEIVKQSGNRTTDLVGLYVMYVDVGCPAGKKAVGGGGTGYVDGGDTFIGYAHLNESSPLAGGSGWRVGLGTPTGAAYEPDDDVLQFDAYAVCVAVA
jgi:hypothetical protein